MWMCIVYFHLSALENWNLGSLWNWIGVGSTASQRWTSMMCRLILWAAFRAQRANPWKEPESFSAGSLLFEDRHRFNGWATFIVASNLAVKPSVPDVRYGELQHDARAVNRASQPQCQKIVLRFGRITQCNFHLHHNWHAGGTTAAMAGTRP
eukprot:SAG31_NODE_11707_length_1005_cov_1.038631_1_plen_152_part_00